MLNNITFKFINKHKSDVFKNTTYSNSDLDIVPVSKYLSLQMTFLEKTHKL